MQESARTLRNQARMEELYPFFRENIRMLLQEMEQAGYRPRIQEAWRSPEAQMAAYRSSHSKLKYGFHNVTSENGTKEALAADIIDDDRPEDVQLPYILHLAAAALRNGMISGAFFGLSKEKSATLHKALVDMKWNSPVSIGWDPLHVQVAGITVEEARAGKRPGQPASTPMATQPTGKVEEKPAAVHSRVYTLIEPGANRSLDFILPHPFKPVTLLAVPYVRQTAAAGEAHFHETGAPCAVMLLQAYLDLLMDTQDFYRRFIQPANSDPNVVQLRNAMGGMGLLTDYRPGLSLADLFDTLRSGKPAMILMRYRKLLEAGLTEKPYRGLSWAVVVGMDCRNIYLHDPLYTDPAEGEAHPYPLDIFHQAWKDTAGDATQPGPECPAILPTAGIGFRLTRKARITAQALHVRAIPGSGGQVVGTLKKNDLVEIRREMNGWGEIGENLWISLRFTAHVPG